MAPCDSIGRRADLHSTCQRCLCGAPAPGTVSGQDCQDCRCCCCTRHKMVLLLRQPQNAGVALPPAVKCRCCCVSREMLLHLLHKPQNAAAVAPATNCCCCCISLPATAATVVVPLQCLAPVQRASPRARGRVPAPLSPVRCSPSVRRANSSCIPPPSPSPPLLRCLEFTQRARWRAKAHTPALPAMIS